MKKIKAVVFGVGTMNSIITRMLLEKGVEIIGAISRSPAKVGKDLGELTGSWAPFRSRCEQRCI